MHIIEIPEEKRTLYMPAELAECDSGQYIEMCGLLYRYHAQQLSFDDLKTHAVYQLLNLKPSGKKLLIVDEQAKWGNIYRLSQLTETFFDDVEGKKVIRLNYISNPVPDFKPLWRTYHGPANAFTNVTFGEYLDGLRLFLDFAATGDENLLRMLTAIFYRKAKPLHYFKKLSGGYDGDTRQAYNEHTVEARAEVFKYAPKGFVYGFYLLFASFQKYITGAEVPWAGKLLDLSILFESSSGDTLEAVPGLGMDSVALALAESGQLGKLDDVRRTNLWQVLILLYDLKKKDLDYKLNEKTTK